MIGNRAVAVLMLALAALGIAAGAVLAPPSAIGSPAVAPPASVTVAVVGALGAVVTAELNGGDDAEATRTGALFQSRVLAWPVAAYRSGPDRAVRGHLTYGARIGLVCERMTSHTVWGLITDEQGRVLGWMPSRHYRGVARAC